MSWDYVLLRRVHRLDSTPQTGKTDPEIMMQMCSLLNLPYFLGF